MKQIAREKRFCHELFLPLLNAKLKPEMIEFIKEEVTMQLNLKVFRYVCVCMYLCMYSCTYVCMYLYLYVFMYIYIYICISVCMCIYVYILLYICMYVCTCAYFVVTIHFFYQYNVCILLHIET